MLSGTYEVTGVVRESAHEDEVKKLSAKTLVLSPEAAVEEYTSLFDGVEVVYYCSGYSASGSPEVSQEEKVAREKAEAFDGAVKVFDAIEAVKNTKPRLIMVSGTVIRDLSKVPEHYVS